MKKTKKTILGLVATVLCLALILSVTLTGAAAADNTLKLVVASDLHIIPPEQYGSIANRKGLPDSGIYSHVNNTKAALDAESTAIFKRFLSSLSSTSSKYVLITGDIVDLGNETSHKYAAEEFAKAEKATGKKILVVPGNNDICYSFNKTQFEETYKDFGFSGALARHSDSLSYTYDLDDNYRLIAIDAIVYKANEKVDYGQINASLLDWILEQAAQAKADGKNPIAMIHQNVLEHTKGVATLFVDYAKDAYIKSPLNLAGKLADAGIKYVFSGHIHSFDISSKATFKGNSIYDVVTGSLSAYPCAYRRVDFSDSSVSFTTKYITKVDQKYLPEGYTDEHLDAMKADFKAYAYGVAEASMKYTVKKLGSAPEKIIEKLKLEEDSKLAAEIKEIVPFVCDYIDKPLYKQEPADGSSFEELAEAYKYTLPQSEYNNCYELLTKLMTSNMEGDENIRVEDVEIKLLRSAAKITLLDAFKKNYTDVSVFAEKLGIKKLKENVFNYAASFRFKETVASKLADMFVEPIIEGVTVDAFEPDDNNATLPSYSAESIIPSGTEAVFIMVVKIIEFLSRIVHTVFHIV